ncbi:Pre-mRNA-splicing factor [Podila minutissima]|uniref:Pre-mRNA-splicing factor n=1 Tax=Podila minutissima TaxID=64525 RepID=A0A9P5SLQ8_9FUNG|nr:Pre-mRNA-splicing factor [Podila minutissima]
MSSSADSRPARKQIAKEKVLGPQLSVASRAAESGQTYNIYYDKWGGGKRHEPGSSIKDKAAYRCDPERDSGRTRGSFNPNAYFCAFFAKGCCPKGEDCTWLHRIPSRQDHVDSGMDVFGRERFDEHRQDHGGVGSMRSDSKTLYVGRLHIDSGMEASVQKHFRQWGEIDRVKILRDKGVAFVTYQSRLNAEFAKEAMANQSLDHGEVINIRWATEDPNPKAQAMNKRKAVEMTRQAIEARLPTDIHQMQHLPGSEEEEIQKQGKRSRIDPEPTYDPSAAQADESNPTLYVGVDGQYYYDYGEYGYNHETLQYDPARLQHYVAPVAQAVDTQQPSLEDRIKASLKSSSSTASTTATSTTSQSEAAPAKNALNALAAYGSDSESESDE